MMDFDPLLDAIVADYAKFTNRCMGGEPASADALLERNARIDAFAAKLSISDGQKYVKVISDNSVWGFIVKAGDPAFAEGDILKAADWSRPARNKARGNIITGDLSKVRWTGPEYLK